MKAKSRRTATNIVTRIKDILIILEMGFGTLTFFDSDIALCSNRVSRLA